VAGVADGSKRNDGRIAQAWNNDRSYLLNIAYRLVGSFSEAEDLVQEAFARLLKTDDATIDDLRGWLVVVVSRLCLDHLRSARVRRESAGSPWFPEPLVPSPDAADPADVVVLDESVRMALLIVLERLTPAERAVFVLHDVFQFSFEEIASIVDRTPAACRQLGSRARRTVAADAPPRTHVGADELRRVAERFIAACEHGDMRGLLDVLDPAVVGWTDVGERRAQRAQQVSGAPAVVHGVLAMFGPKAATRLLVAEINGEAGIVVALRDRPWAVVALNVRAGLISAFYAIADPAKLRHVRIPA
jgi:RNA polymerase sigma-70 factor (ECF subfamily)